jgi:hypothetical protein
MRETDRPARIGFGPVTDANSFEQSGRKVARELESFHGFECGYFSWNPFRLDELQEFDALVFIKYLPELRTMRALGDAGKVMLLDYQDTFLCPSVYEDATWRRMLKHVRYYPWERRDLKRFSLLDGCLVCSPLLEKVVRRAGTEPVHLPRQIYNDANEGSFKQASDAVDGVTLYWTGVWLNQPQNDPVLPVLRRLHDNHGCRILYDTDRVGEHDWIEYRMFDNDTWAEDILDADIAFRWRDTSNLQRFKDANKVQGYMAAGLPAVVCPTHSERAVIRHGETGFFAETVDEFEEIMLRLVKDPQLRSRVGTAAHEHVWRHSSLKVHVEHIRDCLHRLLAERKGVTP